MHRDTELETFFPLLHAMLRATPTSPDELTRSREVMQWAMRHVDDIMKVLDEDESRLFEHIIGHWEDHSEGPSRLTLEALVWKGNLPQPQLALLEDYDKYLPYLTVTDAIDVLTAFKNRQESWRKQQLVGALHQARVIAESGLAGSKREPVDDACDFLRQWLSKPPFSLTVPRSAMAVDEEGYTRQQLMEEDAQLQQQLADEDEHTRNIDQAEQQQQDEGDYPDDYGQDDDDEEDQR
jgi:hypothetical protein